MLSGGVEMIAGVSRDPVFGPVVMVGMGGIHAEILKDVALQTAPVTEDEALQMIRSLREDAENEKAQSKQLREQLGEVWG